MTERPVTETGIFSRSGFSDPSKSAELIKTLKSEINHESLIEDLSKVADPDNALLLLVRIADQQDKNLDKVLEDDDARLRLLQVLGSSNGLGEHLVTYPEDILVFLDSSLILKPSSIISYTFLSYQYNWSKASNTS